MIDIPKVELVWGTGTVGWQKATLDGKPTARLRAPCGHQASLHGHEIAADGTVSPSALCPFDGCDFHEFVRLLDWEEPGTEA